MNYAKDKEEEPATSPVGLAFNQERVNGNNGDHRPEIKNNIYKHYQQRIHLLMKVVKTVLPIGVELQYEIGKDKNKQ